MAITLVMLLGGAAGVVVGEPSNRRSPIVEVVKKTRDSIVTIKVARSGREDLVASGVIVDERGYVVTNHHVVAAGERVTVRLADGADLDGEVLFEDAGNDLAVVRVRARRPLQALAFGAGSDLMVGETVIAVGTPLGYPHTVSTGVISALGRRITMPTGEVLCNLIQTDASINQGNSGGPLLNIDGELIGINVALRDGAQGIAFALNADTIRHVLGRQLGSFGAARAGRGLGDREAGTRGSKSRPFGEPMREAAPGPTAAEAARASDALRRVFEGKGMSDPAEQVKGERQPHAVKASPPTAPRARTEQEGRAGKGGDKGDEEATLQDLLKVKSLAKEVGGLERLSKLCEALRELRQE